MPYLSVTTSSSAEPAARASLLTEASEAISRILHKSPDSVLAAFTVAEMVFGGEPAPSAFLDLRSLGVLSPELNERLADELTRLVERHLGVSPERVFLNFVDVDRSDWGWNGGTLS